MYCKETFLTPLYGAMVGSGNNNIIFKTALKYVNQFFPKDKPYGIKGLPTCNHLIGNVLKDLGIWTTFGNANANCETLKTDPHFIEINYNGNEPAQVGDIICYKREGKSGHNMICAAVDSNGRYCKTISAGRTSKKFPYPNQVYLDDYPTPKEGSTDYNGQHIFRLVKY